MKVLIRYWKPLRGSFRGLEWLLQGSETLRLTHGYIKRQRNKSDMSDFFRRFCMLLYALGNLSAGRFVVLRGFSGISETLRLAHGRRDETPTFGNKGSPKLETSSRAPEELPRRIQEPPKRPQGLAKTLQESSKYVPRASKEVFYMHRFGHVCLFSTLLIDDLVPMWPSGKCIPFQLEQTVVRHDIHHIGSSILCRSGMWRRGAPRFCFRHIGALEARREYHAAIIAAMVPAPLVPARCLCCASHPH